MSFWIILPVKPLSEGKSRLATHLTQQQRYELNKYLLTRTLSLLHSFRPQQLLVVSRCQFVLSLAKQWSADTLTEMGSGGLNEALTQATDWLKVRDVTNVLVIPTDLPWLSMSDLVSLVPLQPNQVLIARDRAKLGTNALFWPIQANMSYQFGEKSCSRHTSEANAAGFTVHYQDKTQLAFDLDTITDYAEWMADCNVMRGLIHDNVKRQGIS